MRHYQYTLTAADVRRHAEGPLQQHLPLADYKRSVPASRLRQLLLAMACWGLSLSATAKRLKRLPSHETVRQALHANLPELDALRRCLSAALQANLPKALRRRRVDLALDLHNIPFYGDKQTPGLRGGKAKAGTKYFWTYATVALLHKGRRWTVGLLPVSSQSLADVVAALTAQVEQAGLRVRALLLDAGFYSAEVIAALQQKQVPFLMPALKRGRLNGKRGPTGTAAFFARTHDGLFEHVWRSRGKKDGVEVRVRLAVAVRSRRLRRKERKQGRPAGRGGWVKEAWVYAFWGLAVAQARSLIGLYRRRFGIESSYRQLRQGLAKTSGTDERLRLLLVGLALLLRNCWVWLHWAVLSTPRRGGRRFNWDRLRLKAMLGWIAASLERLLGRRLEVPTDRPG